MTLQVGRGVSIEGGGGGSKGAYDRLSEPASGSRFLGSKLSKV